MANCKEMGFKETKCSFCGKNKADGVYFGEGGATEVFCCCVCAVEVLPMLMADSVHSADIRIQVEKQKAHADAAFWKALAIRAIK